MARRVVDVAGSSVTVSFDDPPFSAMRWWGIARYQLLDEQSRQPISAEATLTTPNSKVVARGGRDGLAGAVARPWDVLNPLLRDEIALDARVSASGYLDRRVAPRVAVRRFSLAVNASTDTLTVAAPPTGIAPGQRLVIGTAGASLVFEFATVRSVDVALSQIQLTGTVSRTYVAGPATFVVPDEFAPHASALGPLDMHRQPTMLSGRVTELVGGAAVPVAGAEVRVREVWRLAAVSGGNPPADGPQAPWQPPVALLNVPLNATFPVAGTLVRLQNRAFAAATPKQLVFTVSRGGDELILDEGTGIAPGDVISIDAGRPEVEELVEVLTVSGALAASDPVRVTLAHELRLDHPRGSVVRPLQPPAGVPPVRALTQEALEGDPVLLLDMTGANATGQVEIFAPGPPVVRCYHRLRRYAATTNANGVFNLPIARVSRLVSGAFWPPAAPTKTSPPERLEPDYGADQNRFDCLIT